MSLNALPVLTVLDSFCSVPAVIEMHSEVQTEFCQVVGSHLNPTDTHTHTHTHTHICMQTLMQRQAEIQKPGRRGVGSENSVVCVFVVLIVFFECTKS